MDELGLMRALRKHCSLCSEILVHIPFILITFSFFIPLPHYPTLALSGCTEQELPLLQFWLECSYSEAQWQIKPDFKVSVTKMPFKSHLGSKWENSHYRELNIRKKMKGKFLKVHDCVITCWCLCHAHTSGTVNEQWVRQWMNECMWPLRNLGISSTS